MGPRSQIQRTLLRGFIASIAACGLVGAIVLDAGLPYVGPDPVQRGEPTVFIDDEAASRAT